MGQDGSSHYWADGRRVHLDSDPRLAIDVVAAKSADLWDSELADLAATAGDALPGDIVLVPAAEVPELVRGRLDHAGAAMPVYRHDGTTIVVLPEVRVETTDLAVQAALRAVVETWRDTVTMDEPKPGRFVLTPVSGRGEEALDLANQVWERIKPDASQARMMRISPDPDSDPDF